MLKAAKEHGFRTIDGVEMFVRQAAAQFEALDRQGRAGAGSLTASSARSSGPDTTTLQCHGRAGRAPNLLPANHISRRRKRRHGRHAVAQDDER